jgi:hypothetical protein
MLDALNNLSISLSFQCNATLEARPLPSHCSISDDTVGIKKVDSDRP